MGRASGFGTGRPDDHVDRMPDPARVVGATPTVVRCRDRVPHEVAVCSDQHVVAAPVDRVDTAQDRQPVGRRQFAQLSRGVNEARPVSGGDTFIGRDLVCGQMRALSRDANSSS